MSDVVRQIVASGLAAASLALAGCVAGPVTGPGFAATSSTTTEVAPMPDERVRVDLERSGGFTGLRRCASLDTGSLPEAEARQVRQAIDATDLAALSTHPVNPRVPALDLVIRRGDGRVHVVLDETTVPTSLRPLIRMLDERAQPC